MINVALRCMVYFRSHIVGTECLKICHPCSVDLCCYDVTNNFRTFMKRILQLISIIACGKILLRGNYPLRQVRPEEVCS